MVVFCRLFYLAVRRNIARLWGLARRWTPSVPPHSECPSWRQTSGLTPGRPINPECFSLPSSFHSFTWSSASFIGPSTVPSFFLSIHRFTPSFGLNCLSLQRLLPSLELDRLPAFPLLLPYFPSIQKHSWPSLITFT